MARKRLLGKWTRLRLQVDPTTRGSVKRSVLVLSSWSLERKKEKVERKEKVARNIEEGMKDGVPVVVRLVGISEFRNPLGTSNVNQERGSKVVRGGDQIAFG